MEKIQQNLRKQACSYQFDEYVRVGVTRKSCDFLPQHMRAMLRYHVNKFNPFVRVLLYAITRHIRLTIMFLYKKTTSKHICLYFLHLVLTSPHYIIMVKGLLCVY